MTSAVVRIETPGVADAGTLENLQRHADAARGAFAHNTERALRADVAIYTAWCSDTDRAPLPASPETVALFIGAMGAQKAPATIRRYVSSVSTFHRAAGVQNPCDALAVKLALKRLHREKGRAQQQAAPVNDVLIARMLAVPGTTLRHLRNRALVAVAYSTLVRRAELVALQREDLRVDADGFGTVIICRSKTDQEGAGAVAPIAPDAMRHLAAWIEAGKIEDGPLFRSVLKGGRVADALSEGDVPRIYKAMAKAAGLTMPRSLESAATRRAWAQHKTWSATAST